MLVVYSPVCLDLHLKIFELLKKHVEDIDMIEKNGVYFIYQVEEWDDRNINEAIPKIFDELVNLVVECEKAVIISSYASDFFNPYLLDFCIIVSPSEEDTYKILYEIIYEFMLRYNWELVTLEFLTLMENVENIGKNVVEKRNNATIIRGEKLLRILQQCYYRSMDNPRKEFTPILIEPSFTIYYPDMVYSNPTISELDLFIVYNGGYFIIELDSDVERAFESWIRKQIDGGFLAQNISYCSIDKTLKLPLSGFWPPSLKLFKDLFKESYIIKDSLLKWLMNQRRKIFSLDNFMCLVLAYASPTCSKRIINYIAPYIDVFDLIKLRIQEIQYVKKIKMIHFDLREIIEKLRISHPVRKKTKIDEAIILVPTLKSKILREKLAGALMSYLSEQAKVILTFTDRSKGEAEELSKYLSNKGISSIEKMAVSDIEQWSCKILECTKNFKNPSIIALGEIPKNVLASLICCLPDNVKLAVVVWRPSDESDECNSNLNELLNILENEDYDKLKKIYIKAREKPQLEVVEVNEHVDSL